MPDPVNPATEDLHGARDLGIVTYLRAYILLMMKELGVADEPDTSDGVNAMILVAIEPINLATEAIWRAMMQDEKFEDTTDDFRESLRKLIG